MQLLALPQDREASRGIWPPIRASGSAVQVVPFQARVTVEPSGSDMQIPWYPQDKMPPRKHFGTRGQTAAGSKGALCQVAAPSVVNAAAVLMVNMQKLCPAQAWPSGSSKGVLAPPGALTGQVRAS